MNFNEVFDITHADFLDWMKIEQGKIFLQRQRKPNRSSFLVVVDDKLAERKESPKQRKISEEQKYSD